MATMSKEILDEITNDPIKFMEQVLNLSTSKISTFARLFGGASQTQTKTSINSRMETITEGETVKADTGKLIEYKSKEEK